MVKTPEDEIYIFANIFDKKENKTIRGSYIRKLRIECSVDDIVST